MAWVFRAMSAVTWSGWARGLRPGRGGYLEFAGWMASKHYWW